PPYTPVSAAKNVVAGVIVARASGGVPCRDRSQREIHGWTPTTRQVNRISHGAAAAKTPGGRASSSAAPPIAPIAHVSTTAIVVGRDTSRSSRRYPNEPLSAPGSKPIVFEAFATIGGIP